MTIGIFIDDERYPSDVTWLQYEIDRYSYWHIIRLENEFDNVLDWFENSGVDDNIIFSFDHDLQLWNEEGEEITGYVLLKKLIDFCIDNDIPIPVCYFHTQNVVGKKNMESYYNNAIKFQKGE